MEETVISGAETILTTRAKKGSPLTFEEMDNNFKLIAFGINLLMLPYLSPTETEAMQKLFNPDSVYDVKGDYALYPPEGGLFVARFNEGAIGSSVAISGECAVLGDLFDLIGSFPLSEEPLQVTIDKPMYIVIGSGASFLGRPKYEMG